MFCCLFATDAGAVVPLFQLFCNELKCTELDGFAFGLFTFVLISLLVCVRQNKMDLSLLCLVSQTNLILYYFSSSSN